MTGTWLAVHAWMNTRWSWKRCLTNLSSALLVVVSSVATVVMVVLLLSPHGLCYRDKNPDQEERVRQKVLSTALEMFDAKHRDCPQALKSVVEDGIVATHVDLRDEWNRERRYECNDERMMIWSPGADGRFDTADDIMSTTPRAQLPRHEQRGEGGG